MEAFRKVWRVYGREGHQIKESFCKSYNYDFSEGKNVRIISVMCADMTGLYSYVIVGITRPTEAECDAELRGQLTDGIFENQRTGKTELISAEKIIIKI